MSLPCHPENSHPVRQQSDIAKELKHSDNGAKVISGWIYHTRLVLSLQIPLSPGSWFGGDADEASALLKALSVQLNKTGWVEWALHPYIHPFPARQFKRVAVSHRALLVAQTVVILLSAGDLGRIWSSVFYFIDSQLLALLGYTLPVWLQNKGCRSASFPFSCLSSCLVKPSGGRVSQPPGLHTPFSCVAGAVWGCFYPSSRAPEGELSDSTLDSRSSQQISVSGQSLLSKGV